MKKSKKMLAIALLVLLFIFRPQPVSAMHIMGRLSPIGMVYRLVLTILPFFIFGLIKIKKIVSKESKF